MLTVRPGLVGQQESSLGEKPQSGRHNSRCSRSPPLPPPPRVGPWATSATHASVTWLLPWRWHPWVTALPTLRAPVLHCTRLQCSEESPQLHFSVIKCQPLLFTNKTKLIKHLGKRAAMGPGPEWLPESPPALQSPRPGSPVSLEAQGSSSGPVSRQAITSATGVA